MELLEVNHLCKTYGSGETAVHALKDVSFSVPKGEYVAVVGESGSGKSTLLNLIGGLDAGATNFTLRRLSIPSCRSSPTRKARGSNPPGRTKSSTLWGAALFVLRGFYGAVKEGIRTARAPRFASRGAETPRWGVSRARLGESLRTHSKTSLQCVFAMRFFL